MRWAGHVARMGEERGAYRVLVGKPEGMRPLGRPRRRWVDNIRMDLQEVGCRYMEWIGLAQDRDEWRTLVSAVMNLRVPWNAGDFLTSCNPVSFSRRTLRHGVSKLVLGAFVAVYTDYVIKPVTKPAAIPQTYARPWNTQQAGKKLTVTLSFTNTVFAILSTWLALKIFYSRQIYRSKSVSQSHNTDSSYSVFILSFSRVPQLLLHVASDTGFLCDTVLALGMTKRKALLSEPSTFCCVQPQRQVQ